MGAIAIVNGEKRHYNITLKQIGYGREWDNVEYSDFLKVTAQILGVNLVSIDRAYLV